MKSGASPPCAGLNRDRSHQSSERRSVGQAGPGEEWGQGLKGPREPYCASFTHWRPCSYDPGSPQALGKIVCQAWAAHEETTSKPPMRLADNSAVAKHLKEKQLLLRRGR